MTGPHVTLTFDLLPALLILAMTAVVWFLVRWTPGPRVETVTWAELAPGDAIFDHGDTWVVQSWSSRTDAWRKAPETTVSVESVNDDGVVWMATRDPGDAVVRHQRAPQEVPA